MKIIHLLKSNSFSGAENIVIGLMKKIKNKDCIYISKKGEIEQKLKKEQLKYIMVDNLFCDLRKKLKKEKPDIIHAHDLGAIFSAVILNLFTRVKIIAHMHNDPEWLSKLNLKTTIYLFCQLRVKENILVSQSVYDKYIFKKFLKNPIVLDNKLDSEEIIKKSREENNEKFDLIFIGRLTEQKDPLKFIDIIKEVKKIKSDLKVLIIGRGDLEEKVKEKIQKLNLETNVKIISYSDNPYKYIRNSKMLVLTSKWEGYGLVVDEALILDKPVICTNLPGIKVHMSNEFGKLCDNEKEFIDEISLLLKNEGYYKEKVQNIINNFEKPTLDEYTNKIEELYGK